MDLTIDKQVISDKQHLRSLRVAERLRLLRKYYKLIYAAYRELGEKKFEMMLATAANKTRRSSSTQELYKVAGYVGFAPNEITAKTRKREIVEARQVAMFLAEQNSRESLSQIGQHIGGKDRATVYHACKTVESLLETSPEYRKKWLPLIGEVGR